MGIFVPSTVPVRYTKHNYTYATSPTGKLTLTYTQETPISGSVQSSPYVEIDEMKRQNSFNPPNSCPVLDFTESSKMSCSLYHVTPKGQRVYMSNQYSVGTVYLSFLNSNTVFTIRRWNESTPEEALSPKELDELVDSLKPTTLNDLKSTYIKAN